MLTPSGDVKVMDFGIARAIADASSDDDPDRGRRRHRAVPLPRAGPRRDGRLAHATSTPPAACSTSCSTGRPPFVGDSPVAVAYQHVREQAAPPSDHDTDLPPEVDAIVMKSLAKRVEDRYQSAAAMRGDIERYLAGHPVHVTPPRRRRIEPPTTVTNPTHGGHARAAAGRSRSTDERARHPAGSAGVPRDPAGDRARAWRRTCCRRCSRAPSDQVQVPRLAGLTDDQARAKLGRRRARGRHSRLRLQQRRSPANHVISQDPPRRRVRRQGHRR